MSPKYQAKYEENRDVLQYLLEIFHQQKNEMMVLIAVALGGAFFLVINILYANPGGGTTSGFIWFLVKYICLWAAVFFAADILARTFFRKLMKSMALGDADELYRVRIKRREKPLVVSVEFYDDKIINDTGSQQAVYLYSKIHNIMETDQAIGFLAKNGFGPKNFFGVPKSAIKADELDALKAFLLERCDRVRKIKKV